MKAAVAEALAIEVLGWLAAHEDLLPVFLGSTGADAGALGDAASSPGFLGSVLDFLMLDDAWVVEFCDVHGHGYEDPMRARQALPGGQDVSWT